MLRYKHTAFVRDGDDDEGDDEGDDDAPTW